MATIKELSSELNSGSLALGAGSAVFAIGFIAFAFGHVYLGTVGMEGALEGMTRGVVDENWAKEHHDIWYKEHQATVETDGVKAEIEAAAGHV